MADVLKEVIHKYKIEDKIAAFQMDNASNNNTALDVLAISIPLVDRKQSRLRCFSHIINLVVRALLFSNNYGALQDQLGKVGDDNAFKVW
jgi:hypothetical protein